MGRREQNSEGLGIKTFLIHCPFPTPLEIIGLVIINENEDKNGKS